MKFLPRRGGAEILALLTFTALMGSWAALAQTSGAQVKTDRSAYAPGQVAKIDGAGFTIGETVDLTVTHSVSTGGTSTHVAGKAVVDKKGAFLSSWSMCTDAPYGTDVKLTAKGKSSAKVAAASFKSIPASSDRIEAWLNLTDRWGGVVGDQNSIYFEGELIPVKWSGVFLPGTSHTVVLRYTFSGTGQKKFVDFLGTFNVDEEPNPGPFQGITPVPSAAQDFTIPADSAVPSQQPGKLRALNVSSLTFGAYSLSGGVKSLPVTFTVAGPANTPVTVAFAWGAHFASAAIYGGGNGASGFSGASPKLFASLDGQADANVSINTPALRPGDNIPPDAVCPANIVRGNDPGVCGAIVQFQSTVTDNNPGATISCTPPSGSFFPVGTTTVTCTATDEAGNVDQCTFTVTVNDTQAPLISVTDVEVDPGTPGCETGVSFSASATDNCTASGSIAVEFFIGTVRVTSPQTFPVGRTVVRVVATDAAGNASESSFGVRVRDLGNITWPTPFVKELNLVPGNGFKTAVISQCLGELEQSRWYKFKITPASRVVVVLRGLSENYDLVLFKDIAQAYQQLNSQDDLVRINAEFASDAFSPAQFASDAFSAVNFAADAFSPAQFAPAQFSPAQFSPAQFSPAQFSPAQFAPDEFAPAQFSPAQFAPAQFSPAQFSPAQFASAQIQSVIAVSAFDGLTSEGIVANTWNNTGDFYIRVKGRNGIFDPGQAFQLEVYAYPGACETVVETAPTTSTVALAGGGKKTIILWDSQRLAPGTDKTALIAKLGQLATETQGGIVDLQTDPVVQWFHGQADSNKDCPMAKNLVAKAIKAVIDRSRAGHPLEYVVLVGDDNVIPNFRYPDQVLLGPEKTYFPPVLANTASQASLRLNYFLGQDEYGSECSLSLKVGSIPLPGLAVGRLISTPGEIIGVIDAFLAATDGGVKGQILPERALSTGYDFISDAATAIANELALGLGGGTGAGATVDTELIADPAWSPFDPRSWNAEQLSTKLSARKNDIIFLGGHFSAVAALAADYTSYILSSEVQGSSANFFNTLLISIGCHSGYNIVDADAIPFVTLEPDWAQVMARKGATTIWGTGYQYGDTDFIEFSERLYLNLVRQLRTGAPGSGIPVGKALMAAKRQYLADTPAMRGIHEKSLLQVTLYGLPMFRVNFPGARAEIPGSSPIVSSPALTLNPWQVNDDVRLSYSLGLRTADICQAPTVIQEFETLDDTVNDTQVQATYFRGDNGVISNPTEPVLPASMYNVSVDGTVLRGVGFRGGTFVEYPDLIPFTGAAVTEIRGVHPSFLSPVFYPPVPWSVNYLDAACRPLGSEGDTRLVLTPAQFRSGTPGSSAGTFRVFNQMCFRLFYSSSTDALPAGVDFQGWQPGLASPPSITGVRAVTVGNTVEVFAYVTGSPAAGVQEVWATVSSLTGSYSGKWQSFDMQPDGAIATLWHGVIPLNGTPSADLRIMVQAANGVGLVALKNNQGRFYRADQDDTGGATATSVVIASGTSTAAKYNEIVTLNARLSSGATPLAGKLILFTLGDQGVSAVTDGTGLASAVLRVRSIPRPDYELKASFPGDDTYASSFAVAPFALSKQDTVLTIDPPTSYVPSGGDPGFTAILNDATGASVLERTVVFTFENGSGILFASVGITDLTGKSRLLTVPSTLPDGTYTLRASFAGTINLPGGQSVLVVDEVYNPSTATATLVVDNQSPTPVPPATVTPSVLGPPNHKMANVTVTARFTDLNFGYAKIISVTSDEPVNGLGDGDATPDWTFSSDPFYPAPPVPTSGPITVNLTLQLRMERAENNRFGPGRTYTITVQGFDLAGNPSSTVSVTVFVSQ